MHSQKYLTFGVQTTDKVKVSGLSPRYSRVAFVIQKSLQLKSCKLFVSGAAEGT